MYGNKRKAMVFTYDAIIALSLVFMFVLSLGYFLFKPSHSDLITYKASTSFAQDILSQLKSHTVTNLPYWLYENLTLEISPLPNETTIAELLVNIWIKNKTYLVEPIIYELFGNLTNTTNYAIYINNYQIYDHKIGTYEEERKSIAFMPVSGYEENKQPLGYVAKAYATKIQKNITDVIAFSPEGAGNYGGDLTITKKFYIHYDPTTIYNATLFVSLHYGTSDTRIQAIIINGWILGSNSIIWLHKESASTGTGGFGYLDILPYLQQGWNTIQIIFDNNVFNAHIHPGMRVEIQRTSNEFYKQTKYQNITIYYDNVYSQETYYGTGVWATMEFYIPYNAQIHNATFRLHLKGIDDTRRWSWYTWSWEEWDVLLYLNGNLIDEIDYPPSEIIKYYDLKDQVINGTNYLLVYANTYGNSFWGDSDTELYSDPENDPLNSTAMILNYSYVGRQIPYGMIDLSISEKFGGAVENPKSQIFDFEGYQVLEALVHPAQIFSYTLDLESRIGSLPYQLVFQSAGPRGIPSSVFVDPLLYLDPNQQNTIRLSDECSGCDYLPETSLEYKILVPSQVGYGRTFESEQEAIEDAKQRLIDVLGKYINATEIKNETATIGNIPYLYGPAILKVEVYS